MERGSMIRGESSSCPHIACLANDMTLKSRSLPQMRLGLLRFDLLSLSLFAYLSRLLPY
jgi:hypothetical protein